MITHRAELLNRLVALRGYRAYLEIGCAGNETFDAVTAPHKVGVDPMAGGTHRATSDDYFAAHRETFDLVFIDGLHHAAQVERDVDNALDRLNDGGLIVLHDCLPVEEAHQVVPRMSQVWTGDVWKAAVRLRQRLDLDVAVLDADWGLGAVVRRPNSAPLAVAPPELTWAVFEARGRELLRVLEESDFLAFLGAVAAPRGPQTSKDARLLHGASAY